MGRVSLRFSQMNGKTQSVSPQSVCERCGTCCQAGGPALHREDLRLFDAGVLTRAHLVTLRRGEPVHDNVAGVLAELPEEVVKIAGLAGAQACRFHDVAARACAIHDNAPLECRALFCRDTSGIEAVYATGRLTRADLVGSAGALWELVSFHDARFSAGEAAALARRAVRADAAARQALAELVRAEAHFRQEFCERTGLGPDDLDFYFGRALSRVCAPFGLSL